MPVANDAFASRVVIDPSVGSGSTTADSAGCTMETGEPTNGFASSARSVWYEWVATYSGTAHFDTIGSGFDTFLAVFTGSAVNALTRIAFDDNSGGSNTSSLSFTAVAGTSYKIQIHAFSANSSSGIYHLNWTIPTPNGAGSLTLGGSAGAAPGAGAAGSLTLGGSALAPVKANGSLTLGSPAAAVRPVYLASFVVDVGQETSDIPTVAPAAPTIDFVGPDDSDLVYYPDPTLDEWGRPIAS